MLFLSALSGIIGVTTLGVLIAFCISGVFFFYISKKTNIKTLTIMGISLILAGLCYCGICVDFLTIVFTGHNTTNLSLGYLIWPIVPISFTIAFYVGLEIILPKKKFYLITTFIILSIIFELSIFLDPYGNITFIRPTNSGDELIDDSLITGSPAGTIGTIFTFTGIFFQAPGLFYKGRKASGVISKKYYYLAIAYFIINLSALLDFLGIMEIVSFIRIGSLSSVWFFYLGLRKEPEKREKKEKKAEFKIEESLFRLTKKPDHITEEEVTFHRERKICLVCKGAVAGINYICPECSALYCINCSKELSNLENMCWVCNEPIDKEKPSKPFKIEGIEAKVKEKDK